MLSMTSTITPGLHRRQQSTPTMVKSHEPYFPGHPRHAMHRRNMSAAKIDTGLDGQVVGTNPGHSSQHYTQVAQQHSQAIPGQLSSEEIRLRQQTDQLDAQIQSLLQQRQKNTQSLAQMDHAQKMERSKSNPYEPAGLIQANRNMLQNISDARTERPTSSKSDTTTLSTSHLNWNFKPRPATPMDKIGIAHDCDAMDLETIRPVRQANHSSVSSLFYADGQPLQVFNAQCNGKINAVPTALPSPPHTTRLRSHVFDSTVMPHGVELAGPPSPMTSDFRGISPSHGSVDFGNSRSSQGKSSHSGEALLADLCIDATIEDTGISAEEVQSYISEASPNDGKWTCLYEGCGKRFGRKENVRAHVQTHLGDRQYKCNHCSKRFVRQHDLKRHSKTHSGVKPYPCICGASFARHDALTRHRQRNVCAGGLDGYVRKAAKRGRPRKHRPEDDERANKAAMSRRRAAATSYASSASGTSDSSQANSPESMSYDDYTLAPSQNMHSFDLGSFSLQPDLSHTPPMSPYSSASWSPYKASSTVSAHSPKNVDNEFMELGGNAQNTQGSNFGSAASSPPELSHSSPPASSGMLDFEAVTDFVTNGKQTGQAEESGFNPSFGESTNEFFNDMQWKDSDNLFNFDTSDQYQDQMLFSDSVEANFFAR